MNANSGAFSVLIVDLAHHDPAEDYAKRGFASLEAAVEFARRWVRDSVEEFRSSAKSSEELRKAWFIFGEDAIVIGGNYKGSDEIDFFIANPATPQQRDWQSLDPSRPLSER
jgi:hypothetical protein